MSECINRKCPYCGTDLGFIPRQLALFDRNLTDTQTSKSEYGFRFTSEFFLVPVDAYHCGGCNRIILEANNYDSLSETKIEKE